MKTKDGLRRALAAVLVLLLAAAMMLCCGCNKEEKERKSRSSKLHRNTISRDKEDTEDRDSEKNDADEAEDEDEAAENEKFSEEENREYAFKQVELTSFENAGYDVFAWYFLKGFDCVNNPKMTLLSDVFIMHGSPYCAGDFKNIVRPGKQSDPQNRFPTGYGYCSCDDLHFLMTAIFNWSENFYDSAIQEYLTGARITMYEQDGYYYFDELYRGGAAGIYYNCKACYYDGTYFYVILTEDEVLDADENTRCNGTYCAKMQYKQTERGMLWSLYSFTDTLPDTSDVDPRLYTFDEIV